MQRAVDERPPSDRRPLTQRRSATIVVVDDSDICRRAAKLMLGRAGHVVVLLESPIGFTAALREHRADLALVDVHMPALNGDRLVALATKNGAERTCPIVLFSDREAVELEQLTRECGAAGYVRKGSDWSSILRAIEGFLPVR